MGVLEAEQRAEMLCGGWYWCTAHQLVEFVSDHPRRSSVNEHNLIGPYPTEELAREFGNKLWGLPHLRERRA